MLSVYLETPAHILLRGLFAGLGMPLGSILIQSWRLFRKAFETFSAALILEWGQLCHFQFPARLVLSFALYSSDSKFSLLTNYKNQIFVGITFPLLQKNFCCYHPNLIVGEEICWLSLSYITLTRAPPGIRHCLLFYYKVKGQQTLICYCLYQLKMTFVTLPLHSSFFRHFSSHFLPFPLTWCTNILVPLT